MGPRKLGHRCRGRGRMGRGSLLASVEGWACAHGMTQARTWVRAQGSRPAALAHQPWAQGHDKRKGPGSAAQRQS